MGWKKSTALIDSACQIFSPIFNVFTLFTALITKTPSNKLFSKKSHFFPKGFPNRAVKRSNFERTTWFSETSETVISENQLENSSWQ
ncbi:hypothetical protein, partial [Vibrio vulnificus]|uniref:hypothetical protein n=1 Tax=Vibrio vulnificus TaxID=672 RepID=UPI001C116F9C